VTRGGLFCVGALVLKALWTATGRAASEVLASASALLTRSTTGSIIAQARLRG
jgi:hypothetical protein